MNGVVAFFLAQQRCGLTVGSRVVRIIILVSRQSLGLRMVKKLLALVLLAVLPMALLAQTTAKVSHKAKVLSKSRLEAKTLANQMAAGIEAAEAALTPAELAIAE